MPQGHIIELLLWFFWWKLWKWSVAAKNRWHISDIFFLWPWLYHNPKQRMEASMPVKDKAITGSIFNLSTYLNARQYSELSQKKEKWISNICFIILIELCIILNFPVYRCSGNGTVSENFNIGRGWSLERVVAR